MSLKKNEVLKNIEDIRYETVRSIGNLGVGHIGGCLSIADVVGVLYFSDLLNIDPKNPKMSGRDRVILSKGHGGPTIYSTLALKGYFDKEELLTLNQFGTNLPSHCDMNRTIGIDMTTGSLGQGFSCAVGIALGSKIKKDGATIYAIIGDGESQEGQIWEAAMFASHKKLNNFIAFTDFNNAQIDGTTDEINSLGNLKSKWDAFGFNSFVVDGHDVEEIYNAISNAKKSEDKPSMIILKTTKGKGVSFIEEMGIGSHNMPLTNEQTEIALLEIRKEEK